MGVKFTVHPTDDEPDDPLYAIMPSDDGPGYLVGEMVEIVSLRDALNRLIETGEHDGEIHHLDERLGWIWLTVTEAARRYGVPVATVRWAANHGKIGGATKEDGRWRFPQTTFLGWMIRRWRKKKA